MKYTIKDGRSKVWQWDVDVGLILEGVADGTEIHLGYSATTALKKVVENSEILIPNVLLTRNRDIPLFVYHDDATYDSAMLPVEGRPKPPDYIYTEPEKLTWEELEVRIDALERKSGHSHDNKDVLDGITEERVAAWDSSEQNAKEHADKGLSALEKKIPTKTTDLTNDSGFITKAVADLLNYYQKTETYSKEEVNVLVAALPKFSIQVVSELPTADISTTTIYLVKAGEDTSDLYQEYIYVNGAWEHLGSQSVDLTGYAQLSDLAAYVKEEDLPEPLLVTFTEATDGTISRNKTMGDIVVANDHAEVTGILNTPTDKARLKLTELEAVFEDGSDSGYYVAHFEGFYDGNSTTRVHLRMTNQANVKENIAVVDGTDGQPGKDGISPVISVTTITGGHRITITDANGTKTVDVMDGNDGQDGADGSPGKDGSDGVGIASIKQTTTSTVDGGNNVFTVTLTNGTSATFTVKNGSKGSTGADGADGVSVTHSWNGTVLTVTSASGPSSADLKGEQGEKGEKGDKGDTGAIGETGPQGVSIVGIYISEV